MAEEKIHGTEGPVDSLGSVDKVQQALRDCRYLADVPLATSIFLALSLQRPLLLEGEAGVGKTEVAKALSRMMGRRLIRLQCYEGLDLANAVYEWDYSRQLLHIRLQEATGRARAKGEGQIQGQVPGIETLRRELFGPEFLLRRPLLEAIDPAADHPGGAPILLIDELDRADEEFEAFLLEVLSDFQITLPELGTIVAQEPPVVILTSNRTRELHDALRRRCLYQWIDYPDFDKEYEIVRSLAPGADQELSRQVVTFVQDLRREDLFKRPGVAETLDWVAALGALNARELSPQVVEATLGVLLKYQDDIEQVRRDGVEELLASSGKGGE
ncbi:MAG: MoxR family ATPase [Deltaproteobacteria bacterium]|nr:MoxR family ATPase [Deltaproteobacteria bacterium]